MLKLIKYLSNFLHFPMPQYYFIIKSHTMDSIAPYGLVIDLKTVFTP